MPGSTIAYYLGQDIVSRTAADVRAANTGIFATDADVPVYLYTCLMDLFGYADQSALQDHIVARAGSNLAMSDSGIDIAVQMQESAISELPGTLKLDSLGAECAIVKILCRTHDPVEDDKIDLLENVDFRIRYIVSGLIRQYTKGSWPFNLLGQPSNLIPVSKSIDPTVGVSLQWLKLGDVENALERLSIYAATYARFFTK